MSFIDVLDDPSRSDSDSDKILHLLEDVVRAADVSKKGFKAPSAEDISYALQSIQSYLTYKPKQLLTGPSVFSSPCQVQHKQPYIPYSSLSAPVLPCGAYIHPDRLAHRTAKTFEDVVASSMCRSFASTGKCLSENCRWFHVRLPNQICFSYILGKPCSSNFHATCRYQHMSSVELCQYLYIHFPEVLDRVRRNEKR